MLDETWNFSVEVQEAFGEAVANRLVHPIPQVALYKSARVGGFGERFVFAVGEETFNSLRGGGVIFSADVISVAFDFALQVETAKERTARRNIEAFGSSGNRDGYGSVCKCSVAAAVAHAICRKRSRFRCAWHKDSAWAHAKTVGARCLVECRRGEEIFCGASEFCIDVAELTPVDEHLRMFDANAHGKSLAFELDSACVEQFVDVAS